jgi:hypothetical protein
VEVSLFVDHGPEADPASGTHEEVAFHVQGTTSGLRWLGTGVADTASQNISSLYAVFGSMFADQGRAFQQDMEREAQQAEQESEEAVQILPTSMY